MMEKNCTMQLDKTIHSNSTISVLYWCTTDWSVSWSLYRFPSNV